MKKGFVFVVVLLLGLLFLSSCSNDDNFLTDIADEVGTVIGKKDKTPETPPVSAQSIRDNEDELKDDQEEPTPETLQRDYVDVPTCNDSAQGDTTLQGVVNYKRAVFTDYCCGDMFKLDYYCEDGKAQSEDNVLCPLGCTQDGCAQNICGDGLCIGDEFTSCESDCGLKEGDLEVLSVEISDLDSELDTDYLSVTIKNNGAQSVNLGNYFIAYYDYAYPERTSSPMYPSFAYDTLTVRTVKPGEVTTVTYSGARRAVLDIRHCNKQLKVGLAKQRWSKKCIVGSVTLVENFVSIQDVVLACDDD